MVGFQIYTYKGIVMSKDNILLTFFIFWSIFSLISVYGAIMTNTIAWTNIFTLCISFMGLGMMVQKKVRIY